jgi:hypothetical protein
MAGDWIKVQTCTPDKPEVHLIAERLGIDPDAVTGKLIRIWCWADQQTVDGNACSVTKTLLDRVTGVTGFAEMLLQVGWLQETLAGFCFPNFDRHNGNTAKTRASVAKRVEKHRKMPSQPKQKCNAATVTSALPEKRREENNNIEGRASEHRIPDSLNHADCLAAAERWFDYLDSKHLQDKSPRGNEIQLESWWLLMAQFGRDRFLEAVTQSIAAGRWNVELKAGSAERAKPTASKEWLAALKAAKSFPKSDDWEKRKKALGDELFEALKRTGSRAVAESNDWEQKTLKELFESHLKDLRNGTPVSN